MTNDRIDYMTTRAQAFIDRKYVARADERQVSLGLAYVEAERQDLAQEMATFARSEMTKLLEALQSLVDATSGHARHFEEYKYAVAVLAEATGRPA